MSTIYGTNKLFLYPNSCNLKQANEDSSRANESEGFDRDEGGEKEEEEGKEEARTHEAH